MKPEPLREKDIKYFTYYNSRSRRLEEGDVKAYIPLDKHRSAVEWLKKEDNKLLQRLADGSITEVEFVIGLEENKNKAFEDVKDGTNKRPNM